MADDKSGFVAYASHPSFGEEAVEGRIVFDRWRLRFQSGANVFEIPLGQALIEIDEGEEATTVWFRHPDHPEWSLHTFDASILQHRQLRQQANTRNQIKAYQSSGETKRRLMITGAVIGGFILVAILVSMLTSVMVRVLVAKIPPQFEKQIGDQVMVELKKEESFSVEPKLLAKLDRGVAPLMPVLPTNQVTFQFYLMEDPLPNAFALPGGHVVVTTSLLELVDRPEQLAGVVAHEIAHVTLKHGFRKIISAAGPLLVSKLFLGRSRGLMGVLGQGSELLVRQSFSQEYELEADSKGWDYLIAAHINPQSLPDALRKLQHEYDLMRMPHMEMGAFSSHPSTEKRIRRLEDKWKKLKDKSSFVPIQGFDSK